jgi:hypothetical protein
MPHAEARSSRGLSTDYTNKTAESAKLAKIIHELHGLTRITWISANETEFPQEEKKPQRARSSLASALRF